MKYIVLLTLFITLTSGKKEDELLDGMRLFPNPTTDGYLTLKFGELPNQFIEYGVYSMLGETVLSGKLNGTLKKSLKIDLSGQPAGSYFIYISNGDKKITKRITIKR